MLPSMRSRFIPPAPRPRGGKDFDRTRDGREVGRLLTAPSRPEPAHRTRADRGAPARTMPARAYDARPRVPRVRCPPARTARTMPACARLDRPGCTRPLALDGAPPRLAGEGPPGQSPLLAANG